MCPKTWYQSEYVNIAEPNWTVPITVAILEYVSNVVMKSKSASGGTSLSRSFLAFGSSAISTMVKSNKLGIGMNCFALQPVTGALLFGASTAGFHKYTHDKFSHGLVRGFIENELAQGINYFVKGQMVTKDEIINPPICPMEATCSLNDADDPQGETVVVSDPQPTASVSSKPQVALNKAINKASGNKVANSFGNAWSEVLMEF